MSPIGKLMPCPFMVKSQRREVSNGMSWILWLYVYRIISHLYQTGCFVMKGTTLGWRTLEFLRRKTVDFFDQKLIKLFPSCWHERRDMAPTCKPARNHNVRVDSSGLPTVGKSCTNKSFERWVHPQSVGPNGAAHLWNQLKPTITVSARPLGAVSSRLGLVTSGFLIKPIRSNKVRLPSTGSFADWSSKDVHTLVFGHLWKDWKKCRLKTLKANRIFIQRSFWTQQLVQYLKTYIDFFLSGARNIFGEHFDLFPLWQNYLQSIHIYSFHGLRQNDLLHELERSWTWLNYVELSSPF